MQNEASGLLEMPELLEGQRHTVRIHSVFFIRDENMRLVEISKFIGMETSLIEKLRDGGNLLISQASSLRDNNVLITVHHLVLKYFKGWLKG